MGFDKPTGKKFGGQRFNGTGLRKNDPRPGTLEFYKHHIPQRLNQIKATVMESGVFEEKAAEIIALRILQWQETPLAFMKFDPPSYESEWKWFDERVVAKSRRN